MKHQMRILSVMISLCILSTGFGVMDAQAQRDERPTTQAVSPTTSGITTKKDSNDWEVKIWTDKGDNQNDSIPIYYLGERIYVSFQVYKDSYVTVYDIDSTGNINILFPNPYQRDNFARGGRIYTLPTPNYGYDLVMKGPAGKEILFVLASTHVYYHWQYGSNTPPPVWSDQWGTPNNWGHYGGPDQSVTSQRFEKRLQLYEESNLAGLTLTKLKQQINLPATVACMQTSTQDNCECTFYVTMPPY
jgi:hypothetical protein